MKELVLLHYALSVQRRQISMHNLEHVRFQLLVLKCIEPDQKPIVDESFYLITIVTMIPDRQVQRFISRSFQNLPG